MAKRKSRTTIGRSSGKVFADLGLPDAEEKQTKVRLAVAINQIIETMKLSQTAAAQLLHINQPKISALVNYRLSGFSVERLIHFLNALGRDVEIVNSQGRDPDTSASAKSRSRRREINTTPRRLEVPSSASLYI
jgi:predicted XRE-type DNA-binding protein